MKKLLIMILNEQCGQASADDIIYWHMLFPGMFLLEHLLDYVEIFHGVLVESDNKLMLLSSANDSWLSLKYWFSRLSQTKLDQARCKQDSHRTWYMPNQFIIQYPMNEFTEALHSLLYFHALRCHIKSSM
jgi:hypothetical protein